MPTGQVIVRHLPYLRRYARALSGSQEAGDASVAAALESITSRPDLMEGPEAKLELFRIFNDIWSTMAAAQRAGEAGPVAVRLGDASARGDSARGNSGEGGSDATRPSDGDEAEAGPQATRALQAFLLVTMERFDDAEAARILHVDPADIPALIERAGRELAGTLATDVLIIEDEPLVALDLEEIVEGLGHRVLGIARTRTESEQLVAHARPGLVLSDIQLADGSSGLDAVTDIVSRYEVPVIFVTAYPERFMTRNRPEPAFVVPKPVRLASLSAVISQALFFGLKTRPGAAPTEH
jgi:CheY-like chemotaxis protein